MALSHVPKTSPVLVTGATGYVAGWVIKRLLEEGLEVHATVRDPSNTARLEYLESLAQVSDGTIRFFAADLLDEGSFDQAMAGCSVVFHVASPYALDVEDPEAELVEPALRGTVNVLEAVNRTPSVKRVVLTSSVAAVYGDAADLQHTRGGVLTEYSWNSTSSLEHQPYSYSKTLAEKKAWEIARSQTHWKLVVVNPAGVFGPGVRVHPSSESFALLRQIGDGTLASGAPSIPIGLVDVRDVAEAHLAAGFLPNIEGRHILCAEASTVPQMANMLRKSFPGFPFPKIVAPKLLLWLIGPLINGALTRRYVSRNVGHVLKVDHTKSLEKLGITYRPIEETLREHFQQLIDAGLVQSKSAA